MGMEALTNAAIESLLKEVLPKLNKKLQTISQTPLADRAPDGELKYLANEAFELFKRVAQWSDAASISQESEGTKDIEPNLDEISESEFGDAEAEKMLAEMTANDTKSLPDGEGKDLSAEEAKMLEELENGPADLGNASDGEISDDEAKKLLAEMDTPVASTNPENTAPPTLDSEISDDEAKKLLAEMDAPAATKTPEKIESADDEAERLMAELGGADEEEPQEQKTKATEQVATQHQETSPGDEHVPDCDEIAEWEANDFQTDPDMINDFNSNTDELMQTLDGKILELEKNYQDKEIIEEIFRAAHTLKGASGMFGFRGLERVMHRMENLFDLIRKDKLVPTSDVIDVCFAGMDVIKALLEAVKSGKPCGIKTSPVVKALTLVAMGKKPGIKKGDSKKSEQPKATAQESGGGGDESRQGGTTNKDKKKDQSTIRVDLNRLDALVNLVGELVIDRTRFVSIEEDFRTKYPQDNISGNMAETVQLFGRHMNEIQDIIMKVRMVPIGNAFNKFTRIVRDLARSLGKEIDLYISGESAELDKTLVEQIGDPLVHLIRNSCDHGVEMPDVREKAGKPRTGKIFLGARQEGNHIIITIEDDGQGMPVEKIRQKGIEKGLIAPDANITDKEIFNLIFEPGFSTAEKVTNVSGRGVGMDVVKKQISKLKGTVEIDSVRGQGSTITIRLPLTLAIVQSLLVDVMGEVFAIPLSSVIESIRITSKDIQKVGEAEVIKLRDRVLPLLHLDEILQLENRKQSIAYRLRHLNQSANEEKRSRKAQRNADRFYVVVVGSTDRRFGIVVQQLLNQQEMVIKSMGRLMKNIPCVAGGAVMGNGEVVLVLDIAELQDSFLAKSRMMNSAAA